MYVGKLMAIKLPTVYSSLKLMHYFMQILCELTYVFTYLCFFRNQGSSENLGRQRNYLFVCQAVCIKTV